MEEFIEVVSKVTLTKSIFVPKQTNKEATLELAKKLIPDPNKLTSVYKQALMHYGITLKTDLDLKDWDVEKQEFFIDYEPEKIQNDETLCI